MRKYEFKFSKKFKMELPSIYVEFDELSEYEKEDLLTKARKVAAEIPEKIKELDKEYIKKYIELENENDNFFKIMDELNEISEMICELNVLFLQIEGRFIQQSNHF